MLYVMTSICLGSKSGHDHILRCKIRIKSVLSLKSKHTARIDFTRELTFCIDKI